MPTLQFNPPVFTKLLWVPPPSCERRWESKGQNHTLPEPVTTQLQTPALGQTSSAVGPGGARSSELRPINTKMTRKEVLHSSVGDKNGVDAWAVSGQFLDSWGQFESLKGRREKNKVWPWAAYKTHIRSPEMPGMRTWAKEANTI